MSQDNREQDIQSERACEALRKSLRPANFASEAGRGRAWLELLCLFGSGAIFAAGFPPLNWSGLGWIGLIPLYAVCKGKRPFRAWLCGLAWGFGWAFFSFLWIRRIEFFLPLPFGVVLGLFPSFWSAAVPLLRRHLYVPAEVQLRGWEAEQEFVRKSPARPGKDVFFCLVLAAWWCLIEWVRSWIFTGLPWNLLAVTQWKVVALLQICEYTGIYGLSFLLAFFNIALAVSVPEWMKMYRDGRYRRPVVLIVALVVLAVVLSVGVRSGMKRHPEEDMRSLTVALIQGNIPQCRMADKQQTIRALDTYIKLSSLAVLSEPDLVIWPETAVPLAYRADNELSGELRKRLGELIARSRIPFLIGTIDFDPPPDGSSGGMRVYNSALLVGSDGQIAGRYNKQHLVPFGEYTPFGSLYPWLIKLFGMGRSLTPGRSPDTVFELAPGVRGAVQICYEDVFPEISRSSSHAGANVFFVLTNDAWYPNCSEPEQHLSHAVFRAVENRRPIIRSGNNSGSCVITPTGGIVYCVTKDPVTGRPAPTMEAQGWGKFDVRILSDPPLTFYARHPGAFIFFCALLSAAGFYRALLNWRSKKEMLLSVFEDARGS